LLSSILNRLNNNIDHETLKQINNITIEEALKKSDSDIQKWLTDGIIFDKLIFGTAIS